MSEGEECLVINSHLYRDLTRRLVELPCGAGGVWWRFLRLRTFHFPANISSLIDLLVSYKSPHLIHAYLSVA